MQYILLSAALLIAIIGLIYHRARWPALSIRRKFVIALSVVLIFTGILGQFVGLYPLVGLLLICLGTTAQGIDYLYYHTCGRGAQT